MAFEKRRKRKKRKKKKGQRQRGKKKVLVYSQVSQAGRILNTLARNPNTTENGDSGLGDKSINR